MLVDYQSLHFLIFSLMFRMWWQMITQKLLEKTTFHLHLQRKNISAVYVKKIFLPNGLFHVIWEFIVVKNLMHVLTVVNDSLGKPPWRGTCTHTGERPFSCTFCPYTCTQNSNLTKHLRIHTGEKPFSCDVCGNKFTQSSSLKEHKLIHTGEKSHKCDECGKSFGRKNILTKHIRIHTGVKLYGCDYCSKKFTDAGNRNRHSIICSSTKTAK